MGVPDVADPLFTKRVTKSTNNKNSHERVTLEQQAKQAPTAGAMREATLSEMRVSFLCRDSSVADCVEEVVSCISQASVSVLHCFLADTPRSLVRLSC